MKNKLPLLLSGALLALTLTACTIRVGFPEDPAAITTTAKQTDNGAVIQKPTDTGTKKPSGSESDRPAVGTTTPKVTTTAKPVTESTHPYKDEMLLITHPSTAVNAGKTFTGNPPLADATFTLIDPQNKLGLSTEKFSHAFGAAKNGQPHSISVQNQVRFDQYKLSALGWDNKTEGKILYLTFDCGYEYENLTSVMLDTLKEKKVPAAFFCTQDYLEQAPEIVTRMIKDGHIVGNHSTTHPSDCSALTREKMAWEILGAHNYLLKNFGYECKYFRFPAGNYNQNALEVAYSMGYRTAFWSLAHADWDPADQPGVEKSYQTVTQRLHPGAVILLHTTSPDNAKILGDFIDYARAQGYEFRSLDDYEYWDN